MGKIKSDVLNQHLRLFPKENEVLKPFLFNFDINYGRRVDVNNSQFSAYILSPDRLMRDGFAFTEELLLVLSSFQRIQPRIMQAIEKVLDTSPFKGRVDPLTYFLVSGDAGVEDWTNKYLTEHPQARTPIPLFVDSLSSNKNDRWFIRNQLSSRLYTRDLFDYQLPLDGDLFFFGRKKIVDEFLDALRKGQNRGLFGLRKTGKTSFLFKLVRTCDDLNIAKSVYIDCKRPDIRTLDWKNLINYIVQEISKKTGKKYASVKDPVKNLMKLLEALPDNLKVCLIFDEIEYISPLAHLDVHWRSDFVPFWQTLWSIQSEMRKISFVVAGVNPFLCEVDLIDKTQNPMFGIVRPTYLTGLSDDETKQMVTAIGGRMGLGFTPEAVAYLHMRYGGHPLLTRMACSYTNQSIYQQGATRPVPVTDKRLRVEQNEREEDLHFYCRHVVSELKEFYNDEYDMLEMLASGNVVDFNEMAAEPGWVRHLKSYGIISIAETGKPAFRIPVIQKFVAAERSKREGTREPRTVIAQEKRQEWLARRRTNILHDLKLLLRSISAKQISNPYKSEFLPEADLLQNIKLVSSWQDFSAFINDINKCLVETIDIINGKGYFYGSFKMVYPDLFDALARIRLLRNNADHLRLNAQVEDGLKSYLLRDLFDRPVSHFQEPWFLLQQIVLDELFSSVQYEIARIE
ncbi:hypothetical protein [Methylobacterium sp. 17Sr1-1]|uniref:hypothetical protein n=1 Tax=Methylobacterium sp. 17Sr1-1 TaxID=2202826 RepID=UPI0013A56C66|nr:hypothetical protein [Methylobacterium sp. 17Sr1-1]